MVAVGISILLYKVVSNKLSLHNMNCYPVASLLPEIPFEFLCWGKKASNMFTGRQRDREKDRHTDTHSDSDMQ